MHFEMERIVYSMKKNALTQALFFLNESFLWVLFRTGIRNAATFDGPDAFLERLVSGGFLYGVDTGL